MAPRTVIGSKKLGEKIKARRNELGLTIEEAASIAGVGTKTWCRYETGESIRRDKCKGICKALRWRKFPDTSDNESKCEEKNRNLTEEYKNHEAWSQFLADHYGNNAAVSFAVGSDMLLDDIKQDLSDLASMPVGSHIGQLYSFLSEELPAQFLMQYTYEFLYQMKCTLVRLRSRATTGTTMAAHTVMEELLIYLCVQEATAFLELTGETDAIEDEVEYEVEYDYSQDWIFDLFGDADFITFLYSDINLDSEHSYFFTHWNEEQFYINCED